MVFHLGQELLREIPANWFQVHFCEQFVDFLSPILHDRVRDGERVSLGRGESIASGRAGAKGGKGGGHGRGFVARIVALLRLCW